MFDEIANLVSEIANATYTEAKNKLIQLVGAQRANEDPKVRGVVSAALCYAAISVMYTLGASKEQALEIAGVIYDQVEKAQKAARPKAVPKHLN